MTAVLNKVLALMSMTCFIGFIGILIIYVKEPDLIIICLIVIAMAMFDFVQLTRKKQKTNLNK
ncbi:MAG: hypothetical protein AAFO01_02390 [Pseudomonadota bacterium]